MREHAGTSSGGVPQFAGTLHGSEHLCASQCAPARIHAQYFGVMDDPSETELGVGVEPQRIAARVRAAIAYRGERLDEIGERSGLGPAKLRRIASASSPRGATPTELWSIADACGVPRAWLESGQWDETEAQPPARPVHPVEMLSRVEDRLEIIERYLFALVRLEESRGQPLPELDALVYERARPLPPRARPPASTIDPGER